MFTDINKYIAVLEELKISANQFLLCYLHYTDQRVDGKLSRKGDSMANLYKYASRVVPWTKEEVRDLVDKGYLEDPHYHSDDAYPDDLTVTDKFIEKIFIHPDKFSEVFDEFPTLIENFNNRNGPKIKLKSCDVDEMKEIYNKKVRTKVKHRKIIELIKWAKENDEINFNFENFIRGEMWRTLEEVKKDKSNQDDNMKVV